MNLSFKNRIAFHYMVATAIIMAVVFGLIFFVVQRTVRIQLDSDLSYEAKKHVRQIIISKDTLQFVDKEEWKEREHREIQVNPVFIQVTDPEGNIMDKSPNLKQDNLPFRLEHSDGHFDAQLNDRSIRQVQLPIDVDGERLGFMMAAMSSESSESVILKLRNVLLLSYVIMLLGLYFISRFIAGRSLKPIRTMTATISQITNRNLQERVELPPHRDEIYSLSSSFNALLDRIEKALQREKQFTSDASHELRTPLASLRGTLEVLIRKPRTQEEYEQKIQRSLKEIERMTTTLEQLLLLARLESIPEAEKSRMISLATLIESALTRHQKSIKSRDLKVDLDIEAAGEDLVSQYYSGIIINNILSNAIKYSHDQGLIAIRVTQTDSEIICRISDEGLGIKEEDIHNIYNSFFRSEALNQKHISGSGLGLAIAKKCAEAIRAKIELSSQKGMGTTVYLSFPKGVHAYF